MRAGEPLYTHLSRIIYFQGSIYLTADILPRQVEP